ncbi:hypothetical protein MFIFM68171_01672 [Madurella fahalii]|uniref:Uncharacterized protein n=1 Tax=Madurella fahalii TaxID=1157608 RepID=A0ABQ0G141_9PEZI
MVLGDLLGRDVLRQYPQSVPYGQGAKARRICEKVAGQVAKAILEMATWTGNKVCGVDRKLPFNANFVEQCYLNGRRFTENDIVRNMEYAGFDHRNTVFNPGVICARNIVLDDDNGFIGFALLDDACFAPREWVMLPLIDPISTEEADITLEIRCDLRSAERRFIPKDGLDSILLVWQKALSDALIANGYAPVDPHRLPWLRNRAPSMMKYKWWEIDRKMKQKGKSSWKELVPESERDGWWYNHTPDEVDGAGGKMMRSIFKGLAAVSLSLVPEPEVPGFRR